MSKHKPEELRSKILGGGPIRGETFDKDFVLDFKGINLIQEYSIMSIVIEDCVFHGFFRLQNIDSHIVITIRNCSFKESKGQLILDINVLNLWLENCEFSSLGIINTTSSVINITDCCSTEEVGFFDVKSDLVEIRWDQKNGNKASFKFSAPEISELNIESKNNVDKLTISSIKEAEIKGNYGSISLFPETIKSILIESYEVFVPNTEETEGKTIKYNQIDKVLCAYQSFTGILILNDLFIKSLIFDNVENSNGSVRFNELTIEDSKIFDVTIKSFYWNQVWFKDKLTIERCDLSGLKIANVRWLDRSKKVSDSFIDKKVSWFYSIRKRWFDRFESNEDHIENFYCIREFCFGRLNDYDEDDLRALQHERETYRQLKAASSANQNQIESLDFLKNEMRLFWKEIRINGGINWGDRILVFVNRIVSDFGQNWWLPLIWLFGIHFLLLLTLFYGDWEIILNSHKKVSFFGEFITTLNPIHQMPEYVNTDWGKVSDFSMRIFSSYFIFHFIRASRKFGKD